MPLHNSSFAHGSFRRDLTFVAERGSYVYAWVGWARTVGQELHQTVYYAPTRTCLLGEPPSSGTRPNLHFPLGGGGVQRLLPPTLHLLLPAVCAFWRQHFIPVFLHCCNMAFSFCCPHLLGSGLFLDNSVCVCVYVSTLPTPGLYSMSTAHACPQPAHLRKVFAGVETGTGTGNFLAAGSTQVEGRGGRLGRQAWPCWEGSALLLTFLPALLLCSALLLSLSACLCLICLSCLLLLSPFIYIYIISIYLIYIYIFCCVT